VRRHFRVAKALATDKSIPRWVRMLAVFGVLPIPGPVDDFALGLAALIIVVFYRHRVKYHYAMEAVVPATELTDTWGSWS
jgi:hypothetical protein